MVASTVSWDIYEKLRTLDISNSSIPDSALSGQKFRLGQASSWARWGAEQHDLTQITAHDEVEFQTLAPLTTSVVFLGVNWGGTSVANHIEDWQNFHAKSHVGDKRLSNSLPSALETIPHEPGTAAPAPYMTDVFKLIPTPNGSTLEKQIKNDASEHDHIQRCAKLLELELNICTRGNNDIPPLLIALGSHAYNWLTGKKQGSGPIVEVVERIFGANEPRIAKINHGSASRKDSEREEQLKKAIKNNSQFFR